MFNHILAPIDLAHLETLDRALSVTFKQAKDHGAKVTLVSATTNAPGSVAHNPKEFEEKLDAYAKEQATAHGISIETKALVVHDITTDVDDALLKAIGESDADLVIMASHKPGFGDYFWPSNGGKVASHAKISVMLVRDL